MVFNLLKLVLEIEERNINVGVFSISFKMFSLPGTFHEFWETHISVVCLIPLTYPHVNINIYFILTCAYIATKREGKIYVQQNLRTTCLLPLV